MDTDRNAYRAKSALARAVLRSGSRSWRAGNGWSRRLGLHHLAGSRYQPGNVYCQSSFRYSREARELYSHTYINRGVPDNPFQCDVRLPGAQRESNFRSSREGVRIKDKDTFQTQVPDGRGPVAVGDVVFRLGLKARSSAPVF